VVKICSKNAKGNCVAKVRYTQVLLQSITDLAEALGPAVMRPNEEHITSAVSFLRYLILNVDIFFPYGCGEEQVVNKYTTKLLGLLNGRGLSAESNRASPLFRTHSKVLDLPNIRDDRTTTKLMKDSLQDTVTDKSVAVGELASEISTRLEKIRKFCEDADNFDIALPQLMKLKTVTQDVENLKPYAGVIATVINKAASFGQADQDKITRLRTAASIITKECSIVVEGIKKTWTN